MCKRRSISCQQRRIEHLKVQELVLPPCEFGSPGVRARPLHRLKAVYFYRPYCPCSQRLVSKNFPACMHVCASRSKTPNRYRWSSNRYVIVRQKAKSVRIIATRNRSFFDGERSSKTRQLQPAPRRHVDMALLTFLGAEQIRSAARCNRGRVSAEHLCTRRAKRRWIDMKDD